MKHVIYDLASGIVLASIDCPVDAIAAQLSPGQGAIRGVGSSTNSIVVDGRLVRVSTPQPSRWHALNSTGQWQDTRGLEQLRAAKNAEINAAHMTADQGAFKHHGKAVSADAVSRSRMDAVALEVAMTGQLPANFTGTWKAIDNDSVELPTAAAWTAFYRSMVAQGNANFARSQALKALLATASTAEAIDAITWDMNL